MVDNILVEPSLPLYCIVNAFMSYTNKNIMFDSYDMTTNTLEENVKVLKQLVEIQDKIIIDTVKYGVDKEVEKTKKEIEIFILSLKTYIHTQVDDL